ncbi:MAG: hypothetical protein A2857_04070 [Candidatus Levybacteria bacterium RIFCSPHIGHO2_01_FULL_36_15]|nr:MAG: hypothetical protein A2857_04070 [Candidatus Levybacteria bacterium RIFCSPHIGHO2_01_FULL_36_15]OGH37440.1 MAG: hypothetical protein A2905_04885 [Candidatus Levybacteria bacterium RIFCSPLOWO2_01_FULL_36_10]
MEDKKIISANTMLLATSASLTFFWILNIFKEGYKEVQNFLNFYPSVGPLLGLFIFSTVVLIVAFVVLEKLKIRNQKFAFKIFIVSVLLFAFMVFPPVFKIIVKLI